MSQLTARLALLAVGSALVAIVAVSQISVFGATADLTPLVAMAAGLLCGSIPGAVVGFGLGLFLDLALVQTLGLSSLILLVVGYACGRLGETREVDGTFVPIAAGALATLGAQVGYGLAQFLLGVDAPVSLLLLREIATTVLLNALLAAPLYALARRWLGPAQPEGLRPRRRRATTARLSPLS